MEKITLFNTAIGSTNKGDEIIMRCVQEELGELLNKYFILESPTHLQAFGILECIGRLSDSALEISTSKYKFVCGTNLLSPKMFHRSNQWNINYFNCRPLKGSILVGVGVLKGNTPDWYSRKLYKKILSDEYYHSVRDDIAYRMMKDIGLKCYNTGCITLWKLTPEVCNRIPKRKAEAVIFTLTDYRRNPEKDRIIVDIIKENYKEIYFWIQGIGDLEYLQSIADIDEIKIIGPDVDSYEKVLKKNIDYVGTRLHAGIFAMRHGCRSIIIRVDERMDAMSSYIPNNCVSREQLSELKFKIQSQFTTSVDIDWSAIEKWKKQFK